MMLEVAAERRGPWVEPIQLADPPGGALIAASPHRSPRHQGRSWALPPLTRRRLPLLGRLDAPMEIWLT
jgi:hypothetical protein